MEKALNYTFVIVTILFILGVLVSESYATEAKGEVSVNLLPNVLNLPPEEAEIICKENPEYNYCDIINGNLIVNFE